MEVVAILTAVKDGAEVLGKFIQIGSNYRALPAAVYRLADEISGCEHAFDSWKAQYYLEEGRPTRYYEMLWGVNGWQSIRNTLGAISTTCRQLSNEIDGLVDCATKFNRTSFPPQIYSERYNEELVRVSIQRITRKMSRFTRFKNAVTNKAAQIQNLIAAFERQLVSLQRKSQRLIEIAHPETFQNLQRLRGRSLYLQVTGRDKSAYHWTRQDAQLLHKSYASGPRMGCGLGLTVVNLPTARGLPIPGPPADKECDFQLYLSSGSAAHEILAHPVKFRGNLNSRRFHSTFDTALADLPLRAPEPCYLIPDPGRGGQGFTLQISEKARLVESRVAASLKDTITDQRTLYIKKLITHTLVEGFCRLLGSPWLDYFDTNNIHIHRLGNNWVAYLRAVPGNRGTAEVFDRVATNYRRGRTNMDQHAHIYRLGIALTELLLEKPINFVVYDRRDGVKIVIDSISDQALDANDIAVEVEQVTGSERFGDVVFFCLTVLQDRDILRQEDLDADFQDRVLQQLDTVIV